MAVVICEVVLVAGWFVDLPQAASANPPASAAPTNARLLRYTRSRDDPFMFALSWCAPSACPMHKMALRLP
jgi:hypothetical protein